MMMLSVQPQVNLTELRQVLTEFLDESDLKNLCFDLGVEYEDLPGEGRADKARELIRYLYRRGRTLEIVQWIRKQRPDISLRDVLRNPWLIPFVVSSVIAVVLGVSLWLGRVNSPPLPPSVSLISLSFEVDDYNPRLVDLRRSANVGIPASGDRLLRFFDLWISVSKDAPEYSVHAEIYDDPELTNLVGVTDFVSLHAGNTRLGDVKVTAFKRDSNEKDEDTWRVPYHWVEKDLYVALVTYREGQSVDLTVSTIHLDDNGTAWLLDPPNASFASIVYNVNGEPAQVLDLRNVTELGLNVAAGDMLTLSGVWYHAYASGSGDNAIRAEAYLSADGYDDSALCKSGFYLVERGIQKLELDNVTCNHDENATSFRWIIPDDREILVVSLIRFDGALLDRLILPFAGSAGSPGLVPRAGTTTWPTDYVQFLDFEQDQDLAKWEGNVSRTSDRAFTGNDSLQVSFTVTETSSKLVFTEWNQPFTADALVAHYYLPSEPDVYIVWIQFCIVGDAGWKCEFIDRTRDVWQTVAFDFYHWPEDADPPLNQSDLSFVVQGEIRAPSATGSVAYGFYLDAIQVFEDHEEDDNG